MPESRQKLVAHIPDWRRVQKKFMDLQRIGVKVGNNYDQCVKHWDIAMTSLQKCIDEIRDVEATRADSGTESG